MEVRLDGGEPVTSAPRILPECPKRNSLNPAVTTTVLGTPGLAVGPERKATDSPLVVATYRTVPPSMRSCILSAVPASKTVWLWFVNGVNSIAKDFGPVPIHG